MKSDFKLHNSFAFWIHRLNGVLQERFNQLLKVYEITWSQWMLVNLLDDSGESVTPALLAERLGVDRSGVTRLLDRLEKKAYIEREHDKLDRRSVKVRLTDKGSSLIAVMNQRAYQHQQQFLQDLHLSERRGFKKELQKMLRTMEVDTLTLWQQID